MEFVPKYKYDSLQKQWDICDQKVSQRNKQLREIRKRLKELLDHLGDSNISPPLPLHIRKWMVKEVSKL